MEKSIDQTLMSEQRQLKIQLWIIRWWAIFFLAIFWLMTWSWFFAIFIGNLDLKDAGKPTTDYFDFNTASLYTIAISIGCIIFWWAASYLYYWLRYLFVQSNKKVYELLSKELLNIDEVEIVLDKVKQIYSIIRVLIVFRYFKEWFKTGRNYRDSTEEQIQFLYNISKNLIEDLKIKIKKHENIIQQARWEISDKVKETSKWSEGLLLQKVRLDQQIEQFEELQKVLVKL